MGTPFTQGLISSTGITQLYAKIKPCMRVQAETKPLGELLTVSAGMLIIVYCIAVTSSMECSIPNYMMPYPNGGKLLVGRACHSV